VPSDTITVPAALLQRLYDAEAGTITLDGVDYHALNTRWLRSTCGIVQQEALLFDTTVADNIAYGLKDVATEDDIQVCTSAVG
jgi:ABC-type multidrug transport system fused ATPase/permease subunit